MPIPVAANVAVETMPDLSQIAGIVLAGGRSSRMGQDKALLDFKGQPLIRHMRGLLQDLGLKDVFMSGHCEDYPCIEDTAPFAGPVQGIKSVLSQKPGYAGYLFVPVDMPLLSGKVLRLLLAREQGGYFIGCPLPAYITPPFFPCHNESVQGFLKAQGVYPVALPPDLENTMKNTNTPQEWEDAINTP